MEHFERKSFQQFQMRTHVSIILLCNFNLAVSSAKTSLSALGLCSRLGEKKITMMSMLLLFLLMDSFRFERDVELLGLAVVHRGKSEWERDDDAEI